MWTWGEALARQADRIAGAGIVQMQPECWLYASGVGALLRCVRLAGDLGADVEATLASFDAAAPDAQAV